MAKETLHPGFYIPNAGDVSNPRMAEPDRVDFSTLAHPLWGVVEGCAVTVTSTTAQTSGGTLLVNGQLVTLRPGTVGLGSGVTQDRFDLVAADAGGTLIRVGGTPAVDPVFPDPPVNATVLAAVFCPAGEASSFSANVIDKRKFVNKALLTKIATGEDLIRNLNGSGNHFLVDGGGKTTWENDTWMWRSASETLSVHKNLIADGTLTAMGNLDVYGDANIRGNLKAKNFMRETATPVTADMGTIWQNSSTGKVYVWQGSWKEMATIESANPPGTVLTSFEVPAVMRPLGWLPLMGDEINETDFPTAFNIQGLAHLIRATTPRTMYLPDARRRVLRTDFTATPGSLGGNTGNLVTLKTGNLPRHGHNPKVKPGGAANPKVTITRNGTHGHVVTGGAHGHAVNEQPHAHHGMNLGGTASAVIALMWGGQNKIDALFNDRNHTYSVEAMEWTMPAVTGLSVSTTGSEHGHQVAPDGDHDHVATIDGIVDHIHDTTEDLVGTDTPLDITPEYITVYTYLRT